LLAVVFICFGINLVLARPEWHAVAAGFIPTARTVTDPGMLYLAIGIIGATVMPHNLYLHSSTVQTRRVDPSEAGKRGAISFATADVIVALCMALLVNAAILVTSAAVFHTSGHAGVAELQDAHRLLGPLTGTALAGTLFGVALLAAGQSSSVTATLAGQIVMEGFVQMKVAPWVRRMITRSIAIVPAFFVTAAYGESGVGRLLLFSQVVLSLQLPFAMFPLIRFTSSPAIMGRFASPRWMACAGWGAMATIVSLNAILVWKSFG
jgi:manganese transport protein